VAAHLRFASGGPREPLNLVNSPRSALKGARGARRSGESAGKLADQKPCSPYALRWRQQVTASYPFHPELNMSKVG
jgi:hypothetical protein